MQKWEYLNLQPGSPFGNVDRMNGVQLENTSQLRTLNILLPKLGEDGWELVCSVTTADSKHLLFSSVQSPDTHLHVEDQVLCSKS